MTHYGDYAAGDTVYMGFTTTAADGAPIVFADSPAVSVYKDDNDTETTTGVTLAVSDDSRTGWNRVTIATSDGFYTTGSTFFVVVTAGTADTISLVGYQVGSFTLGLIVDPLTTLVGADTVYKKNVAVTAFTFGMIKTDGSVGTGLTVSGRIGKDGAATAAIAGAISEVDNGLYKVNLTQAEMNADEIGLVFTATGARPTMLKIRTQA
jgi:hypothetical protein